MLNPKIKVKCFEDLCQISRYASNLFFDIHSKSKNRFYIIPGGNTPNQFYRNISKQIQDWDNTKFILSDERISEDVNLSNEKMIRKNLLENILFKLRPEILTYKAKSSIKSVEKQIGFLMVSTEKVKNTLVFVKVSADLET